MVKMEELEPLFQELEENYKYLHRHPELGFQERMTSEFIMEKLTSYGIEGRKAARTGIIADIKGTKPGKTVAIRADIDALPIEEKWEGEYRSEHAGKMHACGHDAHTAMLLGAARYLAGHREIIQGRVRLIFQPAEEGASMETMEEMGKEGGSAKGGAASMIAFGALEGVDACFALHVNPLYPVGSIYIPRERFAASSDIFEIKIQGKGGHGSAPENAVDPTGALAALISAVNAFPARELSALSSCSLSIGTIRSGEAWNAIPDSAVITGGLRTFSNETRNFVFSRLEEIADGICRAHRCSAQVTRIEGYAPAVNSVEISSKMMETAEMCFGEENAVALEEPMMGSEDAGYYFQEVPGGMGWLGAMPEDEPAALHNPGFHISLKTLPYGSLFHINMALNYLNTMD